MPTDRTPHTSSRRARRSAKLAGLLAGLGFAVFLVSAWSVPAGTGIAGTDVSMIANLTGELDIAPAGRPFMRDGDLTPGEEMTGELDLHNQTPARLSVRLRARPDAPGLDRLLLLEVKAGKATVYRGTLGGLRRFSGRPFTMAADARRTLSVRAWLPRGVGRRSGNRAAESTFEFRARPVEG